ncbi:MAG: FHA domain-containing protein [Polyangiaceae bacterium]|nr:FHA domain-containing protein [Polyangiaceae bacterium]
MIICPKCTKENQDHYKFCLGCGAELPRDAAPKKFAPTSNTPPQGVAPAKISAAPIADEATSQGQGPGQLAVQAMPSAPPAAREGSDGVASVVCPQCSHPNPSTNKFCASCGFKLAKAGTSLPAPAADGAGASVGGGSSSQALPPAQMAAPAPGPAPAPLPGPAVPLQGELPGPTPGGITLTALRADGSEAGSFHMAAGPTTIGRDSGGIFAGDSYLSPRHATFTARGRQVVVRDESSLNGVYRKIGRDEPIELGYTDIFRIGQEILRIEPLGSMTKSADGVERLGSPARGYVGRLALLIGRDTTGNAYPIPESGLHLGRERGDVLFPEDGYVSGLHCRISSGNGKLYLTDLGSSNGSFVRLQKDTALNSGDVLLMGQQLFRVAVN